MNRSKILGVAAIALVGVAVSGCSSIRESRGYIVDSVLVASVQPGIDNQRSVEATLGRPTFSSQFGEPTWYYVSSTTGRKPFRKTRIKEHQVLAVKFDKAGNVIAADRTGMDQVVYLSPDGDFRHRRWAASGLSWKICSAISAPSVRPGWAVRASNPPGYPHRLILQRRTPYRAA